MRDSSRRVVPSRADDVVNFYAEALTLAAPAVMNAGDARPIIAFFLPIDRSWLAIMMDRSIHGSRPWSPSATTGPWRCGLPRGPPDRLPAPGIAPRRRRGDAAPEKANVLGMRRRLPGRTDLHP